MWIVVKFDSKHEATDYVGPFTDLKEAEGYATGNNTRLQKKKSGFGYYAVRKLFTPILCEDQLLKSYEKKHPNDEDRKKFTKLAKEWKKKVKGTSNVTKRCMEPAYQHIIGMGAIAVPLILEELKDNGPDDWFWALTAITGENPVTQEIAGDMMAMRDAWLEWGRVREAEKKGS